MYVIKNTPIGFIRIFCRYIFYLLHHAKQNIPYIQLNSQMKAQKLISEDTPKTSMNKTIKKTKISTNETLDLPPINFDQLQTKRNRFKNIGRIPCLNLADCKKKQSVRIDSSEKEMVSERVQYKENSYKGQKESREKTADRKRSQGIRLPSISMRNSNLSTCQIKRKKSAAHCKIIVPKNCPFPFSNRVTRGRSKNSHNNNQFVDFLGLDMDISRISERSNQSFSQNLVEGCLFSKNSIQEIPIF